METDVEEIENDVAEMDVDYDHICVLLTTEADCVANINCEWDVIECEGKGINRFF